MFLLYSTLLCHSYWLEAYRGTGADSLNDCVPIHSRTSSCDIITSVDSAPKVEHRLAPPLEVSLSWVLQHLAAPADALPLSPEFRINKSASSCYTPRRNADVETALVALGSLNRWCQQAHNYFFNSVFSQAPDQSELDMSVISSDSIFVPVLPLLNPSGSGSGGGDSATLLEQKSDEDLVVAPSPPSSHDLDGSNLSISDVNAFLQEQHRTLASQCEAAAKVFPAATAHRSLISAAEGTLLVTLLHMRDIVDHYFYGVDYIEELLRDQLISAIGKVVQPKDFSQYMKYHNTKLLKAAYQPRPFCYSVRRSDGHAPEGGIFLEESGGDSSSSGELAEAINTLVSSVPPAPVPVERQFTLNASTTVNFTGSTHVHAYMSHRFQNDHQGSELKLRAEARQFSGFIVLIGSIPSATTFDPKHAFICQNKDEFTIPVDTEMIPSPKAFKDAIESLSPEQQRFAKAFRGMQLASTLFGVLVVQIKPQLEKILNLPADSLTKEIKLNQDLMELFIKYQIPSDLLSYDTSSLPSSSSSSEVVSVREKLQVVKGHVAAMHEMIGLTKTQELSQRREEVQFDMAPALYSMSRSSNCEVMEEVDNLCDDFFGGSSSSSSKARNTVPQPKQRKQKKSAPMMKGKMATRSSTTTSAPISQTKSVATTSPPQKQQHKEEEVPEVCVTSLSAGNNRDCTLLPSALNEKFEALDKDGAVRPVILSVGKAWKKRSQKALLAAASATTLHAEEQKTERSAAFDLLDALSRSGGLTIDNTDLHVVLVSTHCFDKTLMNTIIQKNTNPIEKMEQSTLIMASVIHGRSAQELANENQHERLHNQAAMLFEED